MEKRAYGAMTLIFIIACIMCLLLGIFWLFTGIGDGNSGLVLQGLFTIIFGFGIGAVTNFLK